MDTLTHRFGRLSVDIPVTIVTVLDTVEATIANLTEHGALITGFALTPGARFQIDYFGQILYAQCRWSEIDRMGAQFAFPLVDGPLYERLTVARMTRYPGEADEGAIAFAPMHRPVRTFGRRAN